MKPRVAWLVFGCTTLILGALFFWPLGRVLAGGFWVDGHLTARYLFGVFQNPVYVEGLLNSLKIALGTTGLAMVVALPLAWLANQFDFRGKAAFSALVLVPMILPPFVGAIASSRFSAPMVSSIRFLVWARATGWAGGNMSAWFCCKRFRCIPFYI